MDIHDVLHRLTDAVTGKANIGPADEAEIRAAIDAGRPVDPEAVAADKAAKVADLEAQLSAARDSG
jgi:hypothetical protein